MRNNVGLFLTKRAHLSPAMDGYIGVESGQRFSYRELNARCNRTANMFAQMGVSKGDRVALLLMNGVEFVETFFALAKLGAVVVPLNWRLVADELAFILGDAGATLLVYDQAFEAIVGDLHARGAEATRISGWVQVGGDDAASYADSYDRLHAAADDAEPVVTAEDGDPLYIMYTSGTTGLPKGAVHTHTTVMWACITSNATGDSCYGDRYIVALPLFHVGALTPLTTNVYKGVTSLVMRSFDPTLVWKVIEEESVTCMLAVPAMLNFMNQVPARAEANHKSLRWIMSGAAPVPVSLIEIYQSAGIPIHQVYGLTETCGPACLISPEDALVRAGSTGKPFFHTDVKIVDAEGAEVAPGEVGEVVVSAPHLMTEYWNRPEATAETIQDGWLHTGDLATMDDDGFVYIQDRKKDMIISGGENIYPAEIENVILQVAGVADAAVIGQPSEKWGESPLAVVVRADAGLQGDAILEHCSGKLARFKQPRAVEFIDEIPRNPSGKILKRILRDQFPGPADE